MNQQDGKLQENLSAGRFYKLPAALAKHTNLSPAAKIVWAVLHYREGRNGECWPSLAQIASDAGISRRSAIRAVQQLKDRMLLTIEQDNNRRKKGRMLPNRYRCHTVTSAKMALRSQVHVPGDKMALSLDKENQRKNTIPSQAQIEAIYQAYPRHVGKRDALSKITKTLKELAKVHDNPADWLLERVQVYATSPAGNRGTYTPYPATWFKQERYNDDEKEWQRTGSSESERNPARVDAPDGKYAGVGQTIRNR